MVRGFMLFRVAIKVKIAIGYIPYALITFGVGVTS